MGGIIYLLGAAVSLACAVLLLRGYAHARRRLLLFSGLCFIGLALSNTLVFVDLVVFTAGPDLYLLRLVTSAISMIVLMYGLIWERN